MLKKQTEDKRKSIKKLGQGKLRKLRSRYVQSGFSQLEQVLLDTERGEDSMQLLELLQKQVDLKSWLYYFGTLQILFRSNSPQVKRSLTSSLTKSDYGLLTSSRTT